MSSTTGRMPAMAAPTPSPTIAVSEIGVSRTRSPNRSRRPRVRPKTLPPSPTSMPATNTRSSAASSASSAARTASMVRNTGASLGGRRRLAARRPRPDDEVGERWRRRGRRAAGRLDRVVELGGHRRLERLDVVVADAGATGAARRAATSGSRASHSAHLLRRPVALRDRLRSGRASGRWRPRRRPGRSPARAAPTTSPHGRGRGHHVVAVDGDVGDAVARRPAARAVAACWVEAGENSA